MTAAEDPAIEVKGLTKTRHGRAIVDNVSFHVPWGSITALLGPNGAGKSTTLGMMLGLIAPTSGTTAFEGLAYRALQHPSAVVGVLLDAVAGHPGRSVDETLHLSARLGGVDRERREACLDLVGLSSVRHRMVGALSLGMRQRLGLAIALLGNPRILILDEPGNGLDPDGLLWLNTFMTDFARRGGAVLLSSHHLGDMEELSDNVVILDRGRVVHTGRDSGPPSVEFSSANDDALHAALRSRGITTTNGEARNRAETTAEVVGLTSVDIGVPLTHLRSEDGRLQQLFLQSTNGEHSSRPTADGHGR